MKIWKKWFWRFSIVRSEGKKKGVKICQIHICGFHCVAKHIEWWLNICILFLVYSQIWLNLLRDDCNFYSIFRWMIATLATNRNSWKRKRGKLQEVCKAWEGIWFKWRNSVKRLVEDEWIFHARMCFQIQKKKTLRVLLYSSSEREQKEEEEEENKNNKKVLILPQKREKRRKEKKT